MPQKLIKTPVQTGPADGAPTGGWWITFWRVNGFFCKMTVTQKQKVKKSIRRCEIDRLSEDFKRAIDKIWGPKAKNGILGRKLSFWAQKNSLLRSNHVLAIIGQSCANKKVSFSQMNFRLLANFRCFW